MGGVHNAYYPCGLTQKRVDLVSRKKKAARAAAKRIPLVGTAVVIVPAIKAATVLNSSNVFTTQGWMSFFKELVFNYTGVNVDGGPVAGDRIATTYTPIAVYLLARRFAGRHISRVLRPLGIKF